MDSQSRRTKGHEINALPNVQVLIARTFVSSTLEACLVGAGNTGRGHAEQNSVGDDECVIQGQKTTNER